MSCFIIHDNIQYNPCCLIFTERVNEKMNRTDWEKEDLGEQFTPPSFEF